MAERAGGADRIRAENLVLREMVAIYSELSGLSSQDTDTASVLRLIADRLGVTAALIDADLEVIATAAPGEAGALAERIERDRTALGRLVAAAARTRRPLSLPAATEDSASVVVAPILLGDRPVAYLLTAGTGFDASGEDTRLMVTEHAAMICGIVLGRSQVVAAAAGQARRDLFEGLLLPERSDADAEGWARHLGIKPDLPHRVMTVVFGDRGAVPSSRETQIAALVEHVLLTRCHEATVIGRGAEVVAVVPASGPAPAALSGLVATARQCTASVEARFADATVAVGIGNCYPGATRVARSYAEARHAVDTTALMSGLGGVVVFAELGIHRLLARVGDLADLRSFATDVLGELLEHDRGSGADYLQTLTVYFNENNSPQRAARRLHLHPNTVAYRVRRIEEITGLSLNSYSDRLVMQVALEIVNGLGDGL